MNLEVYVLGVTPQFDRMPTGTLRVGLAAKSDAGATEREIEIVFNGPGNPVNFRDITTANQKAKGK